MKQLPNDPRLAGASPFSAGSLHNVSCLPDANQCLTSSLILSSIYALFSLSISRSHPPNLRPVRNFCPLSSVIALIFRTNIFDLSAEADIRFQSFFLSICSVQDDPEDSFELLQTRNFKDQDSHGILKCQPYWRIYHNCPVFMIFTLLVLVFSRVIRFHSERHGYAQYFLSARIFSRFALAFKFIPLGFQGIGHIRSFEIS
jgi:hypothetical protein